MAPVVLFQDNYIMLGVVAIISLFVHIWSSKKYIKIVSGGAINNQPNGQYKRFLSILSGVNQLTLFLAHGFLVYVAIQRLM
jgi:hypothetical protein